MQYSQGAFTPDANRANDLHVKSMQRHLLFARMRRREWRELSVFNFNRARLKNLNFGGYSRRVNQSGACSSSDVITSGGKQQCKIRNNNGGQSNCGCMWVPGAVYTSSYFYKNRNRFCNETGSAWQKPLPWREFASVVCSEFHARMKRVTQNVQASNSSRNSAIYSRHSRLVWTHLQYVKMLIRSE